MRIEAEIREMMETYDNVTMCLQGSRDFDYVGAPTREQINAYVAALSWVLEENETLPRQMEVIAKIFNGEAEPLSEEEAL
jgi:hypothetical protein